MKLRSIKPDVVVDQCRSRWRWPLSREATEYLLLVSAMGALVALSAYLSTL